MPIKFITIIELPVFLELVLSYIVHIIYYCTVVLRHNCRTIRTSTVLVTSPKGVMDKILNKKGRLVLSSLQFFSIFLHWRTPICILTTSTVVPPSLSSFSDFSTFALPAGHPSSAISDSAWSTCNNINSVYNLVLSPSVQILHLALPPFQKSFSHLYFLTLTLPTHQYTTVL